MAFINTLCVVRVNTSRVARHDNVEVMKTPAERLAHAREQAGYATATDAARAMGLKPSAYINHENNWRGFERHAARYAAFFRVSLEWLSTGKGDMKPRRSPGSFSLPVRGKVGAGAIVDMQNYDSDTLIDEMDVDMSHDMLLAIEGDSQWPRFMAGEWLIVAGEPVDPARLIGGYAVVQCEDTGRRLVKMLLRGTRPGTYRLDSHNAPPEDNVKLLAAWRIKGTWLG